MLKIAVTTVEAFRTYLEGELKLETLLSRIRGEFTASKYMDLGTAFHDIVENIHERFVPGGNCFKAKNGIEFDYDLINECYNKLIPEAACEVKLTKVFDIGGEEIEIVGKVDQLHGAYVIENKTCWGFYDFERFYKSCQWKLYMSIFEADRVFYNVFCLKDSSEGVRLESIEQFSFEEYPDLMKDINYLLSNFLEFIHSQKLEEFFSLDYRYKKQELLPARDNSKPKIHSLNENESNKMNIQKIKIANLLGIEELEFDPGRFTLIEGKNGSGKTSILESIKHALNGGHDAKLLRNGTDKGEIVLILDDGVQLSKTVTASKSDLKLVDKDGNKIFKPQTYIDKLIDMLSVNPVQFLTSDKKNRVNYLLEAIPMKLTQDQLENSLNGMSGRVKDDLSGHALEVINRIYKQFFDERTGVNRSLKDKTATLAQLEQSVSNNTLSISDLDNKVKELGAKKSAMEGKKVNFIEQIMETRLQNLEEEECRFVSLLEELRADHDRIKSEIDDHFDTQKSEIESRFDEKYKPLMTELITLQEQQKQVASQAKTREIIYQFHSDCLELKSETEKLTGALTGLDKLKEDLLKDLPIKDLEIKDGEIFCKDIVFDKLNTAQQVKLAVDVAKLRAGELGIICVDGIERLDGDTFNEFRSKALESGLQMIVTKVGDSELNIHTESAA